MENRVRYIENRLRYLQCFDEAVELVLLYRNVVPMSTTIGQSVREKINELLKVLEDIYQEEEELPREQPALQLQDIQEEPVRNTDNDDGWIQIVHRESEEDLPLPFTTPVPPVPPVSPVLYDEWLAPRNKRMGATRRQVCLVVSKAKCAERCPTQCAVCFEIPIYQNAARTQCDHYYCKECLDLWINQLDDQSTKSKCPVCRASVTTITTYRPRKVKTDRQLFLRGHQGQPLNIF